MEMPARPPIVLPRAVDPPRVPRAMLLGLGLLLSICGWWATFIGVWMTLAGGFDFLIAVAFGLVVLGLAVASFTNGFGDRTPRWWRVTGAVVTVVSTGAVVLALATG